MCRIFCVLCDGDLCIVVVVHHLFFCLRTGYANLFLHVYIRDNITRLE